MRKFFRKFCKIYEDPDDPEILECFIVETTIEKLPKHFDTDPPKLLLTPHLAMCRLDEPILPTEREPVEVPRVEYYQFRI